MEFCDLKISKYTSLEQKIIYCSLKTKHQVNLRDSGDPALKNTLILMATNLPKTTHFSVHNRFSPEQNIEAAYPTSYKRRGNTQQ